MGATEGAEAALGAQLPPQTAAEAAAHRGSEPPTAAADGDAQAAAAALVADVFVRLAAQPEAKPEAAPVAAAEEAVDQRPGGGEAACPAEPSRDVIAEAAEQPADVQQQQIPAEAAAEAAVAADEAGGMEPPADCSPAEVEAQAPEAAPAPVPEPAPEPAGPAEGLEQPPGEATPDAPPTIEAAEAAASSNASSEEQGAAAEPAGQAAAGEGAAGDEQSAAEAPPAEPAPLPADDGAVPAAEAEEQEAAAEVGGTSEAELTAEHSGAAPTTQGEADAPEAAELDAAVASVSTAVDTAEQQADAAPQPGAAAEEEGGAATGSVAVMLLEQELEPLAQEKEEPCGDSPAAGEGEETSGCTQAALPEEPRSMAAAALPEEPAAGAAPAEAAEEAAAAEEEVAAEAAEEAAAEEEPTAEAGEETACTEQAPCQEPLQHGEQDEAAPAPPPPAEEREASATADGARLGVASADLVGRPLADEESYGQLLQREVSAKLLQVLSEQQLAAEGQAGQGGDEQAQGLGGQLDVGSLAGSAAGGVEAPAGEALPPVAEEGCLGAAPADGPLLKWAPVSKKGSPQGRRAPARTGALASSPPAGQASGAAELQGSHSTQRRRMVPLPASSSPSAAAAAAAALTGLSMASGPANRKPASRKMPPLHHTAPAGASPTGAAPPPGPRQRRMSRPSMHEILGAAGRKMGPTGSRGGSAGVARPQLATAPPHVPPNQPPMQLPGFGAAPAAFPPLAAPPASEALLRWGKWVPPQAPAVAAMPGAQPGWYAPMPGFMPPGMLLPPAAFVVLPGAGGQQAPPAQEPPAEEPAPGGPPADASDSTATAEPGSPLAEAAPEGEGAAAGGAADSGATAPTEAAGMDAPAWEQDGNDGDDEAHPYYAPGAAPPPPHAVDVSASWPPYEGAKLPPLYKDQVSSTAGLIPAVHSLAAFTAAPPGRAHQPGWAQHPQFAPFMAGAAPGWGVPTGGPPAQGPAAHYGGVPPMAWVGPDLAPPQCDPVMAGYSPAAATLPPEQQQALLYQQQAVFMQQQASYYQQAAAVQQYMRQAQQAQPRQHGGAAVAHADEPVFTREPPPVLPIALDASGRPFKVCHGVAVRGMRRPEHYQADGRPAWTR